MFYSYEKSCPINGSSTDYEEVDLDLSAGTIHQVDLIFPSDSDKDLHAQIWQGGHQLWPSNRGGTITGDNMVISFREFFGLDAARNNLTLKAWNVGTSDAKVISVNIGILPEGILQPFSIGKLLQALGK